MPPSHSDSIINAVHAVFTLNGTSVRLQWDTRDRECWTAADSCLRSLTLSSTVLLPGICSDDAVRCCHIELLFCVRYIMDVYD